MKIARSKFAGRLREFADFTFGDDASGENRGQWREFFRRRIGPAFDGRIVVEIGCSDADTLCKIAPKHRATGFVGLDWKCKSLYLGAERINGLRLENIALLNARGQDVVRLFADGEVDEAWVFHPEPLEEEIEIKNRLIGESFLADVHRILRSDESVLAIKTDHLGYYQELLSLFDPSPPQKLEITAGPIASGPQTNASPAASLLGQRFELRVSSADYWHDSAALAHTASKLFSGEVTFYENRFIKKRMPIYYAELRKKT